jgi:hypothetical protein
VTLATLTDSWTSAVSDPTKALFLRLSRLNVTSVPLVLGMCCSRFDARRFVLTSRDPPEFCCRESREGFVARSLAEWWRERSLSIGMYPDGQPQKRVGRQPSSPEERGDVAVLGLFTWKSGANLVDANLLARRRYGRCTDSERPGIWSMCTNCTI